MEFRNEVTARDLIISAFFYYYNLSVISNLYRPIWGYVYAAVNLVILTLFFILKIPGL